MNFKYIQYVVQNYADDDDDDECLCKEMMTTISDYSYDYSYTVGPNHDHAEQIVGLMMINATDNNNGNGPFYNL